MGMILPATDGKAIIFSRVCFKIILLFPCVCLFCSCFENNMKTFKMISCGWENSKSMSAFFNSTAIQNIPVETKFILILKTRITKLEGSWPEGSKAENVLYLFDR